MYFLGFYSRLRYLRPIQQKTYYSPESEFFDSMLDVFKETNANGMCIIFRPIDEHIQKLSKTVNINKETVKSILKVTVSDLETDKNPNIDRMPLMKIGSYYVFLPFMVENQPFDVSLIDMIEREILSSSKKVKFDVKKWTEKFELYISDLFKNFKFKVLCGQNFFNDKKQFEVDVIAFKDKTIFIIELKLTYLRLDNRSVLDHRRSALLKAGKQIQNALEYFETESGKEDVSKKLGIQKSEIERIYPLVVTNSFEDDYFLVADKFRKISSFELERIVRDDCCFMFPFIESLDEKTKAQFDDSARSHIPDLDFNQKWKEKMNDPDFHENHMKRYSIREDKENCSSGHIIDCIENDKVWKHLDSINHKSKMIDLEINGEIRMRFCT